MMNPVWCSALRRNQLRSSLRSELRNPFNTLRSLYEPTPESLKSSDEKYCSRTNYIKKARRFTV